MPTLNGDTIRQLLHQRGLDTRVFAERAGLSERTIRNALGGVRIRTGTLAAIADALRVSPASLLITASQSESSMEPATFFRDISGTWKGTGEDLIVPGHIEYKIAPVTYQFEMDLSQTDRDVDGSGWLIGQENMKQPFEIRGVLKEEGNFLQFEWCNADPRINDFGTGVLEHTADGKQLIGYFVGRERVHSDTVIFGRFRARRVKTD